MEWNKYCWYKINSFIREWLLVKYLHLTIIDKKNAIMELQSYEFQQKFPEQKGKEKEEITHDDMSRAAPVAAHYHCVLPVLLCTMNPIICILYF